MPTVDSPLPDNPKPPYPFERTTCACRLCTINCEHLPGALAPRDLPIIAAHLGYADLSTFVDECLLASDGAKGFIEGRMISLPTLVPSTGPDGFCRFLKESRCSIHAVSPYGCAYIDAHMPDLEFNRRANALHTELLADRNRQGDYSRLTDELHKRGQSALPLEKRRYRLEKAIRKEMRQ